MEDNDTFGNISCKTNGVNGGNGKERKYERGNYAPTLSERAEMLRRKWV